MIYAQYYNNSTHSYIHIYLGSYKNYISLGRRASNLKSDIFVEKGKKPYSFQSKYISDKRKNNFLKFTLYNIVSKPASHSDVEFKLSLFVAQNYGLNELLIRQFINDDNKEKPKVVDIDIDEQEDITINLVKEE